MNFSVVFESFWESHGNRVKQFSDETSPCPDLPMELWVKAEYLSSARDAMCLLLLIPLVVPSTRNYALLESLRGHMAKMCSNYGSQGNWKVVQAVLEQTDSCSVYQSWSIILDHMSPEDFFGNIVPRMMRLLKVLRYRPLYSSVVGDTRFVRKPQRKRGYDDKGSLSLIHRWLPRVSLEDHKNIVQPYCPQPFAWWKLYG